MATELINGVYHVTFRENSGGGGGGAEIANDSIPAPQTLIRVDYYSESAIPSAKGTVIDGTIKVNFDGFILKKYATLEVQGASSASYPKKNWTVAFYNDDQYASAYSFRLGNMVPHSEYVIKANYIDATHCRNIVCNRIWEQIVQARPGYPKREDEVAFNNSDTNILRRFDSGALCHVDGFPCVLYVNGAFYGIGDFNIGKKRNNYNLNKDTQTEIQMQAEDHANFNSYTAAEWEIRNPKTPDGNFTTRIAPWFASNALTGASFKSGFEVTHNLQNAIDYYLFIEFLYADDCVDKNFQLTTWDGAVFSFLPYDLDTVFNLYWDGSQYTNGSGSVVNGATQSAKDFWTKFLAAYKDEIVARYLDLKEKGIFSVGNVYRLCAELTKRYGPDLFAEEFTKWPNIPSNTSIHTSVPQILSWVASRLTWMDGYFAVVPLQSLAITGDSSITGSGQYGVTYTPNDTTETGVVWSIQSGSEYASIDQTGLVTALTGADSDTVVIRATSAVDSSIYADKTITVTAAAGQPLLSVHKIFGGVQGDVITTEHQLFGSSMQNWTLVAFVPDCGGNVTDQTGAMCMQTSGSYQGFIIHSANNLSRGHGMSLGYGSMTSNLVSRAFSTNYNDDGNFSSGNAAPIGISRQGNDLYYTFDGSTWVKFNDAAPSISDPLVVGGTLRSGNYSDFYNSNGEYLDLELYDTSLKDCSSFFASHGVGTPEYTLANHTCLGTEATAVNTGEKIFNATDYPNGFNLVLDFTPSDLTGSNDFNTIIGSQKEESPFPGFVTRVASSANKIYLYSTAEVSCANNQRHRLSVGYDGSLMVIVLDDSVLGVAASAPVTPHDWPLCVGGALGGLPSTWYNDRFTELVVHSLKVWAK